MFNLGVAYQEILIATDLLLYLRVSEQSEDSDTFDSIVSELPTISTYQAMSACLHR